jgi:hypothetical protein
MAAKKNLIICPDCGGNESKATCPTCNGAGEIEINLAQEYKKRWVKLLAFQLKAVGIEFKSEYHFCPNRLWRADFYIKPMILVEFEGLTNPNEKSRHTTNQGYTEDCEKYAEAQILRFDVLRFTQKHIKSGYAIETIRRLMEVKREWGE